MLIHQGEGSGTPTEPHHIPSQAAQPSSPTHISSPSIPTVTSVPTIPIPTVILTKSSPLRQYTRRARIAQSSALLPIANEPASPEVEINKLKERVKILEDNQGVIGARSGDDALIKGMRIDEEEVTTERLSSHTEEVRLDEGEVPTGSGSIPTAGIEVPTGSDVVPTASLIFTTATVVAKEIEEKLAREDQKRAEQIARDAEIARIHVEEELQSMIESLDSNNETVAKYLEEYRQFSSEIPMERRIELISDLVKYQDNYTKVYKFQSQQRKSWTKKQKRDYYMAVIKNNLGWKVKDFKGMTFEDVEAKFNSVCKQMEDFIPMGSKEEAERIKRKDKRNDVIGPIEEVYVEALQVKHLIIDWKVHIEGQRAYWKITRLGGSSASYKFFTDLLKHLDREDLNKLWTLVKETLSSRPPTIEWKLYDSCRVHHVAAKGNEIFMLVEKDYPLRKGLALVMISYKLQKEYQVYGRIVGNKMHNAFPLLVRKFPLPEGTSHCLKKNATARRKEMPLPEDCTAIIVKKKLVLITLEDPDLSFQHNCRHPRVQHPSERARDGYASSVYLHH
nr:hypothetical protein [Tanacetum cinerariifolium]